jgi:hypothetical protein
VEHVGSNTTTLVSDATGNVFALSFADHNVYEHLQGAGYSWNTTKSQIISLVSDATGNVFALSFGDHHVYEHQQGTLDGWMSVFSAYNLVSDATGNIFVTRDTLSYDDHFLYERDQVTGNWTMVGGSKCSNLVSNTAGNVFALNSDAVYEHKQGTVGPWSLSWSLAISDVSSLAVQPNGTLYTLGLHDLVLRYSTTSQPNSWKYTYSNVDEIAVTPNGVVYALLASSSLYTSTTGLPNSWQVVHVRDGLGPSDGTGDVHGLANGQDGRVFFLHNGCLHCVRTDGFGTDERGLMQKSGGDVDVDLQRGGDVINKVSNVLQQVVDTRGLGSPRPATKGW